MNLKRKLAFWLSGMYATFGIGAIMPNDKTKMLLAFCLSALFWFVGSNAKDEN